MLDQNQRDFLSGRSALVEDLKAWFRTVDLFRDTQDERMILRDPTSADLRQHRTWVAGLIGEGERLVTETLERGALADGAVQFNIEDVEATVHLLYRWQRDWHGEKMSPERRREILKAVFNVEEPAA